MSNNFINTIVGTGTFAVPTTDAELQAATVGLSAIINTVAGLSVSAILGWVQTADGAGADRTLNCLLSNFTYNGEVCPDSSEVETLTAAIKTALEANASITSVGIQQVSLFDSPGSGSTDKRGPAVIVGNLLEGDSLADCDYLDTGNGDQLDAAVTAAGALSPPADVWVRPGLYDLGLAGAPAAAIDIPIGVTLRGAGIGSTLLRSKSSGDFNVFALLDYAEIQDLYVEVPFPIGIGASAHPGAVSFAGVANRARNVEVYFVDYDSYTPTEVGYMDLLAAVHLGVKNNDGKAFDCRATGPSTWDGNSNPESTSSMSGFRSEGLWSSTPEPYMDTCTATGFDFGFSAMGFIGEGGFECIACRSIEPAYSGFFHYGEGRAYADDCYVLLSDLADSGLSAAPTAIAYAIDKSSGQESLITASVAEYTGVGAGVRGVLIYADDCLVVANRIKGFVTAIDIPLAITDSCIVTNNRTFGGVINDLGVGNLVANNITTP